MNQETKTCQNCRKPFVIEPEDFLFYAKIKVPAPTWCPECRMRRRMVWRNERAIYKRKCDATGETVISAYSADKPLKVFSLPYWFSDNWDIMEYGREYDFSRPFFVQFLELLRDTPRAAITQKNAVNSEYTQFINNAKNSYLAFGSYDIENCFYTSANNISVKDCMDVMRTTKSELCYETLSCSGCYRLSHSRNCADCSHSAFLYNCSNCSHCFGCVNLKNKRYHIFNEPHSPEEYRRKMDEIFAGEFENFFRAGAAAHDFWLRFPRKFGAIVASQDVSGDEISHTKNCHYCFFTKDGTEDCKYSVTLVEGAKDIYDVVGAGVNTQLGYEGVSLIGYGILFSAVAWNDSDVQYSESCTDSHDLFGCIGLHNKQYCILNKQYTKEEYTNLVARIMKHMDEMPYTDAHGRVYKYGEFFPPELSPFAYNETIAQEYFPLTKEAASVQGYRWKDQEEKEYTPTMHWRDLPDHINDVADSILNEAILCRAWDEDAKKAQEHNCTKVFRIIPQELAFYRKMHLPLPRFCPNSRHFHRIQQRNPLKLWHRACQCVGIQSQNGVYQNTASHSHGVTPCSNEFETSYAPERPEIVYCEQCYQAEVV